MGCEWGYGVRYESVCMGVLDGACGSGGWGMHVSIRVQICEVHLAACGGCMWVVSLCVCGEGCGGKLWCGV